MTRPNLTFHGFTFGYPQSPFFHPLTVQGMIRQFAFHIDPLPNFYLSLFVFEFKIIDDLTCHKYTFQLPKYKFKLIKLFYFCKTTVGLPGTHSIMAIASQFVISRVETSPLFIAGHIGSQMASKNLVARRTVNCEVICALLLNPFDDIIGLKYQQNLSAFVSLSKIN